MFAPYWPLYLRDSGFGPGQIASLMALMMAVKVVAPTLWGWAADRSSQRITIVRLAVAGAFLSFGFIFLSERFFAFALVMMLFGFFWTAALPQFEVVTLGFLQGALDRYTLIRLWGSVGFIAAVLIAGVGFQSGDYSALPVVILVLLSCVGVCVLLVPRERASDGARANAPALLAHLRSPYVVALIVACFLMQLNCAPFYTFFSIYLSENQYSAVAIGWMWSLGVIAEVALFLFMPKLFARYDHHRMFFMCFVLTALRWCLVAWCVEWPGMIVLSQILHAASFGLYHALSIRFVHEAFPGALEGRGQALYSALSFGAGGALGSWFAGWSWVAAGSVVTWLSAAGVSALGAFIVWRWMPSATGSSRTPLERA